MENCVFCNPEISKGEILYETDNFFVNLGLGLAAPGHVMLVPKCHCDCYADMPSGLRDDFKKMKDLVYRKIQETFGDLFMVEYGIMRQSVRHAHLHFIPKKRPQTEYYPGYQINNIFETISVPKGLGIPASWSEAEKLRRIFGGYIYLKDKTAQLFAEFLQNYSSENLGYRHFFNDKLKLTDIPRSWKEINGKNLQIDLIKKEITRQKLKF